MLDKEKIRRLDEAVIEIRHKPIRGSGGIDHVFDYYSGNIRIGYLVLHESYDDHLTEKPLEIAASNLINELQKFNYNITAAGDKVKIKKK